MPNGRFALLGMAVLAYTFAGAGVYWLRTGHTIIEHDTVSTLGALVWFGPLLIGSLAIWVIGDRGPLRALYYPRETVSVSADGLEWWTPRGRAGRLAWSDLGGASRAYRQFRRTTETIYDLSGAEVASLEGGFAVEGSRRSVSLPTVILDARPSDFVPFDPRYPERGCLIRRPGDGGDED